MRWGISLLLLLAFPLYLFASPQKDGDYRQRLKSEVSAKLERVHSVDQEYEKIPTAPKGLGRYVGNLISVVGILAILGIAYLLSIHRRNFNYRLICWGIGLQVVFALLILHTQPGRWVFEVAQKGVNHIISFTNAGAGFVLGVLSNQGVMNEVVNSRVQVYVDGEGRVYVRGRVVTTAEYSPFLMGLSPKARKTAVPANWPRDWQTRWKNPTNPKSLAIPFEVGKQPVMGVSYGTAYQYAQWKARQDYGPSGFIFVFQILTTIIFFSSLMAVLYHLGIMQKVVYWMAKAMAKTMGTSGAESLAVATNVFVGQTEAPLVVRPYVPKMTQSELMALMTGGFATIAGGVLVAFASFGIPVGHLLAASVMSAPAALVMAKIIVPETEHSLTAQKIEMEVEKESVNVIDAAAAGAGEGMKLALNVAAMLLAFIALVAMADALLAGLHNLHQKLLQTVGMGDYVSLFPQRLSELFGILFAPLALIMGVSFEDVFKFASLIGTKIAVNEFVAYLSLKELMPSGLFPHSNQISTRTFIIGTYALCGFANFGSIAIQLGGIGGIAPERRHDLARLGLRAMFGGALASFMTATVAGVLLSPKECDWRYAQRLAKQQIATFVDTSEVYALAEFAKPFYEYSKKYAGEDQEALEGEVRHHIRTIFRHYAQKGQAGREQAYLFVKIFQKRYPSFKSFLEKELKEMEGVEALKGLVQFVRSMDTQ